MKKLRAFLVLLIFCAFTDSEVKAEKGKTPLAQPKVRNLILLIGDGMGPSEVSLALFFSRYSKLNPKPLYFESFLKKAEVGLVQPSAFDALVVDSACSGTALASGVEAKPETIGLNEKGDSAPTILERARKAGKSTGLVSDTRITHATPAVFASHVPDRNMEEEIAKQMLSARVDVLLSGGLKYFNERSDKLDLIKQAKSDHYDVVYDRSGLTQSSSRRLLGLFSPSFMPNAFFERDNSNDVNRIVPTLTEMTKKSLEVLNANPSGFFLMIEAGQIDWAGHANDAGWLLQEMLRLDRALGEILKFIEKRNDTLLVLTADHETGGFGFSYSDTSVPAPSAFDNKEVKAQYSPHFNFVVPPILDTMYQQQGTQKELGTNHSTYGVVWATGSHTTIPVIVAALGPQQSKFNGFYRQTQLGKLLAETLLGDK